MSFPESAIEREAIDGSSMTRRSFYLTIGALLILGFGMLALTSWAVMQPGMAGFVRSHELAVGIGGIVGTVAGIVAIGVGGSKKSIALMLVGYLVFTLSFGATTSIWLTRYNFATITSAFTMTAAVSLLFAILGILFPRIFERLVGVAFVALLGIILASFAMMLLHLPTTWIDYATIAVFSIFIGYDVHKAAVIEPNPFNAVMVATNIFIDIVNVFVAILNILDND